MPPTHPSDTLIFSKVNGREKFVVTAAMNGQPCNKTFLTHEQITSGGEIVLNMTSAPNCKWAIAPENHPAAGIETLK